MDRSIVLFVVAFGAIFGAAYFVMQRGNGLGAPAPPADNTDGGAAAVPEPKEAPKQPEAPAVPRRDLLVNRWALPGGLQAPDRERGTSIVIDPAGPRVLMQSRENAFAWDAATGATQPTTRLEPDTVIHSSLLKNNKLLVQICERKTGSLLVEFREKPTRLASMTPDGKRVIVVLHPSTYPSYSAINIGTGETTTHPERPLANVQLYDTSRNWQLNAFAPKARGLDDDVWAVKVSPDGRSFFLVTKSYLVELDFHTAFNVEPLPARAADAK